MFLSNYPMQLQKKPCIFNNLILRQATPHFGVIVLHLIIKLGPSIDKLPLWWASTTSVRDVETSLGLKTTFWLVLIFPLDTKVSVLGLLGRGLGLQLPLGLGPLGLGPQGLGPQGLGLGLGLCPLF